MLDIVESEDNDFIMAVSSIFSLSIVQKLLNTDTISIEIMDTLEAIYDRLVLNGDDALEYKEKYKQYYMNEIK